MNEERTVHQEARDQGVNPDQLVNQAKQEKMVNKENKVFRASKGRWETPGLKVSAVREVFRAKAVLKGPKETRAYPALLAHQVFPARGVPAVLPGRRVTQVLKGQRVTRVRQVNVENQDQWVNRAKKVYKDREVAPVTSDSRESVVHQVHPDNQVPRDSKVPQAHRATKDQPVVRDRRDLVDPVDPRAHQARLVTPVLLGLLETKEREAQTVHLGYQALRDLQDSRVTAA